MQRLLTALGLTLPLVSLTACGDDSGSPAAPSSTATAVNVTVAGPLRVGQTTQATGSEVRSGGQSQAITSGWQSDAPAVATVTSGGLVTGVANGRATIFVVAGGRQGQQVLRVVPDYQGRWSGGLRVTSCVETGVFAEIDFCDEFPVGSVTAYSLGVAQLGEQIVATASYGGQLNFPPVTTPIRDDGSVAFSTSASVTEAGVTISVDPSFAINSARVGELTGTVSEVWRVPNIAGEARLVQEVVGTSRTSTATSSRSRDSRGGPLRKLSSRERARAY